MYQALKLANVPEEQAVAAAEAVAQGQDAATKSDLTELAARLSSQMDIRFAELRKEINERFSKHEASLAVLKFAVFSGGSVVVVLLIKLVFFP